MSQLFVRKSVADCEDDLAERGGLKRSLGKWHLTALGVGATIGAGLQTLIGGNITVFTTLCEQTRSDAFDIMIQHATEIGANAIIGARYDTTELSQGVTEVLAYGTAVIVEPTNPGESYRS